MIKKESKNVVRKRRHARIRASLSGTAECPRLNVFRSNNGIYVQVIDDTTGNTLVSSSSIALKLKNGGNIEAASAVGKDIAEKCNKLKIKKVVFDRGGYLYHGRVEALADAAVGMGMTRNQAYLYASQTLKGAASMQLETGKHPAELKDAVCSPAGTTIEGVKVLERLGFRSAIINAAEAAFEKSQELGRSK